MLKGCEGHCAALWRHELACSLQIEKQGKGSAKGRLGGLGPFAIMSLAYILFTTTDGGVRIIVLLHAYTQGFTALALACIFSGYELAGVIVNLLAGLAGMTGDFLQGLHR